MSRKKRPAEEPSAETQVMEENENTEIVPAEGIVEAEVQEVEIQETEISGPEPAEVKVVSSEPEENGEAPAEGEALESGEPPIPMKRVVEAILFASQKPVSAKELLNIVKGAAQTENPTAAAFGKIKEAHLRQAIEELENDCAASECTHEVRETATGWQLVTKADFAPWLRQLYPENRSARLSAPAMETLAIIAYRQPITRADIEAVRGVAVDGVMQTLLDRGLVKIAGRAEIPGRPLLYETTQHFMEHFGLKDLDDLPNSSELRKISLPTAEAPAQETPKPAAQNEAPAAGDQPPPVEGEAVTEEPPAPEENRETSI